MILFVVFAIFTMLAVTKAEGMWKIWNVLIILGSCAVGFLVAFLAGSWARNMGLGGQIAIPSALAFGSLAAVLCPRKKNVKKAESNP